MNISFIYCIIDVRKTLVVACIATANDLDVNTYKLHRFSTFMKNLKGLLQWLLDNNYKDICMESIGKYWMPIFNILEADCKGSCFS